MSDAELEKTTATISISTNKEELTASGEVLKFEGFLKVYREDRDDEDINEDEHQEGMLPPLQIGQQLPLIEMFATERFTRPLPRYTEASLVKKLEELGIGRPSTYAPTISTILKRGYVEKRDKEGVKRDFRKLRLSKDTITKVIEQENTGAEKSKLFPSDLGMVVTDFLKQYFDDIMDYGFTARIEEEFDEVAAGKMKWNAMIDDFYIPFKKDVENTIETAERVKGERDLGLDPESGKKIVARMGRYGPMVQIGESNNEEEKPRFAALKKDQSIETITLEEALQLFRLPRVLGVFEDQEVAANVGRYGPYIKYGEQFISIPKGEDPLEITLQRAIEIIREKQQADAPIYQYDGLPVTRGKGRFGPYIKWNEMFINVPKRFDFDALSEDDISELIEAKKAKEANRFIRQWPEEKISIENGRWGPFIRFNKKMLKIGRKKDESKYTAEELQDIPVDTIKEMIVAQVPNAFSKKSSVRQAASRKPSPVQKKAAAPKNTVTKKAAPKSATKAASKKATPKKAAPKKKK
jgi:DNA topoisomerase-1